MTSDYGLFVDLVSLSQQEVHTRSASMLPKNFHIYHNLWVAWQRVPVKAEVQPRAAGALDSILIELAPDRPEFTLHFKPLVSHDSFSG
ncbi:MAG: hypothetical protein JO333_17020 [Verrucomicrobia bacterium]|nr:hypothetical protein [Verrucomicrobiota bacterium]